MALIRFFEDEGVAQVRSDGTSQSQLAIASGGFIFNYNSETDWFETPKISIPDAQACLTNLENSE